jgi:hypothetical protein
VVQLSCQCCVVVVRRGRGRVMHVTCRSTVVVVCGDGSSTTRDDTSMTC